MIGIYWVRSRLIPVMIIGNMKNNIVIQGEWDGELIWRYKTPEEKLEDAKINPNEAMIYLSLLANNENKHI